MKSMNKNKLLVVISVICLISWLPAVASWQINEKECNCKIVPTSGFWQGVSFSYKQERNNELPQSILEKATDFAVPDANNNFVDLNSGQYIKGTKFDFDTGKYKVRDKWYQAKWVLTEGEKAQIDTALIESTRLQKVNTFLLFQGLMNANPIHH